MYRDSREGAHPTSYGSQLGRYHAGKGAAAALALVLCLAGCSRSPGQAIDPHPAPPDAGLNAPGTSAPGVPAPPPASATGAAVVPATGAASSSRPTTAAAPIEAGGRVGAAADASPKTEVGKAEGIVLERNIQGETTAGRLADLDAQVALLQRELTITKLQTSLKIADQQKAGAADGAIGTAEGGSMAMGPSVRNAAREAEEIPVVSGLYGVGDKLIATLVYPNGGEVQVEKGSVIPGGTVRSIDRDGVSVVIHGRRRRLMFATAPLSLPMTNGMTAGFPGMFPPPPLPASSGGATGGPGLFGAPGMSQPLSESAPSGRAVN